MKTLVRWKFVLFKSIMWILTAILTVGTLHLLPYQLILIFDWQIFALLVIIWKSLLAMMWVECMPLQHNMHKSMVSETVTTYPFMLSAILAVMNVMDGDMYTAKILMLFGVITALAGASAHIARRLVWVQKVYRWFLPGAPIIVFENPYVRETRAN